MPRKAARDTKKLILQVALKQFSEKGFDGVGIRDIAKEIGIRESAIYRHYSGRIDSDEFYNVSILFRNRVWLTIA
jgi:AcrR family transcriptional regulator